MKRITGTDGSEGEITRSTRDWLDQVLVDFFNTYLHHCRLCGWLARQKLVSKLMHGVSELGFTCDARGPFQSLAILASKRPKRAA